MSITSIKHAITEGLKLAKKSFVIFLIYYLFNILLYIHATEFKEDLQYALFYMPIYIAFLFSVPSLLDKVRMNVLTARNITTNILVSLWRLIIPFSIFTLLIIFPIIYLYENNPAILRNFLMDVQKQQGDLAISDYLTSALIVSLFSFTTLYFALDRNNIFSSMARSVATMIGHPIYLFLFTGITFIQIIIRNIFEFDSLYGNLLFTIPIAYLFVLISSTTLIYFQDTIKKPSVSATPSKNPIIRWFQTSSPSRNLTFVIIALSIFYFVFFIGTGTVPPQM